MDFTSRCSSKDYVKQLFEMLFIREFQNRGIMLRDFRETDSLKNTPIKIIS